MFNPKGLALEDANDGGRLRKIVYYPAARSARYFPISWAPVRHSGGEIAIWNVATRGIMPDSKRDDVWEVKIARPTHYRARTRVRSPS